MADSDSDNWVLADVESDDQEEKIEDGFCLIKHKVDSESDAEGDSDSESDAEGDAESVAEEEDNNVDLSAFSVKRTPKRPKKNYAMYSKDLMMKMKIRIEDVVREHVLHYLPAKSLWRFKTVSKGWDKWISNPFFAHSQATYFKNISGLFCLDPGDCPYFVSFNQEAYGMPDPTLSFLPQPVTIRASSSGLLCCQSVGDNVYYMCNPVTKEWKMLPRPNYYHGAEAAIVLAFEPHPLNFGENYEIVCAFTIPDNPVLCFEIYSSRSSSWRLSNSVCSEPNCLELYSDGFYMKGVAYWKSTSGVILAFDVKDEQYGILPLPLGGAEYGALTVMHGELCYIVPRIQDNDCDVYIYGNMDMSLKTVINLSWDVVGSVFGACCRALPSIDDDILMFLVGRKLIAYHVREREVELICTTEASLWTSCFPYVNSLIRLSEKVEA